MPQQSTSEHPTFPVLAEPSGPHTASGGAHGVAERSRRRWPRSWRARPSPAAGAATARRTGPRAPAAAPGTAEARARWAEARARRAEAPGPPARARRHELQLRDHRLELRGEQRRLRDVPDEPVPHGEPARLRARGRRRDAEHHRRRHLDQGQPLHRDRDARGHGDAHRRGRHDRLLRLRQRQRPGGEHLGRRQRPRRAPDERHGGVPHHAHLAGRERRLLGLDQRQQQLHRHVARARGLLQRGDGRRAGHLRLRRRGQRGYRAGGQPRSGELPRPQRRAGAPPHEPRGASRRGRASRWRAPCRAGARRSTRSSTPTPTRPGRSCRACST